MVLQENVILARGLAMHANWTSQGNSEVLLIAKGSRDADGMLDDVSTYMEAPGTGCTVAERTVVHTAVSVAAGSLTGNATSGGTQQLQQSAACAATGLERDATLQPAADSSFMAAGAVVEPQDVCDTGSSPTKSPSGPHMPACGQVYSSEEVCFIQVIDRVLCVYC
jgi:hypothetical protein